LFADACGGSLQCNFEGFNFERVQIERKAVSAEFAIRTGIFNQIGFLRPANCRMKRPAPPLRR